MVLESLSQILLTRAQEAPDQTAFTFLADGEREEQSITCRDLDAGARAVAASLQAAGGKGERALLLFPSGLEFIQAFFGCLYAGVVAVHGHGAHGYEPVAGVDQAPGVAASIERANYDYGRQLV
ncbi:MAG: AMP-binding protein, partial [Acidobacteriota bacterium]